jgi:hypothetical protein
MVYDEFSCRTGIIRSCILFTGLTSPFICSVNANSVLVIAFCSVPVDWIVSVKLFSFRYEVDANCPLTKATEKS